MKELLKRFIMRHLSLDMTTSGRNSPRSLRSQKGQAVLEYILVLVVILGIILGVMYQLNGAFKKYVQSYFGEYIACLLETGEMPTLGGGDGATSSVCAASFEPFSLKNGRPMISSDGGGSKGGGGRKFSRNASAAPRGSRITKNRSTMNAERLNNGGTVAASTDAKGEKKQLKRGGGGISSGSFKFKTARMRQEEQIRLDRSYLTSSEKDAKKESNIVKEIDTKSPNTRASRKLAVDMTKFKNPEKPPEVALDLSAGDYLRYILIFAILIGIFVFFGGQLNQLRKSWEK